MIVLDASIAIALLDADDAHHHTAVALLGEHVDDDLAISTLTLAEVLVRPAQLGAAERIDAGLRSLGVTTLALGADAALELAHVRAATGLRMPDAVVLHAAETAGAALATADRVLLSAARARGVVVLAA
ncbi:PIN domain-containing protein [Microbacter sp. GSS18]|nr:PIN domain-containing protein [Microbacter sp. GSS18]